MYFLYSSSVVAPTQCSSPRASIGFSMLPASEEPSVFPAPTIVWISSMKSMIFPSDSLIFLRTALSLSSNCPRYMAPAISAVMSREKTVRSFSPSGTSPLFIRCARPSTIAVLPTPGSPMRTGLFFVFRDSMRMTSRISVSRPITGTSFPALAIAVRYVPYFSRHFSLSSGGSYVAFMVNPPSGRLCVRQLLAVAVPEPKDYLRAPHCPFVGHNVSEHFSD